MGSKNGAAVTISLASSFERHFRSALQNLEKAAELGSP
jgi:hypothetical protein